MSIDTLSDNIFQDKVLLLEKDDSQFHFNQVYKSPRSSYPKTITKQFYDLKMQKSERTSDKEKSIENPGHNLSYSKTLLNMEKIYSKEADSNLQINQRVNNMVQAKIYKLKKKLQAQQIEQNKNYQQIWHNHDSERYLKRIKTNQGQPKDPQKPIKFYNFQKQALDSIAQSKYQEIKSIQEIQALTAQNMINQIREKEFIRYQDQQIEQWIKSDRSDSNSEISPLEVKQKISTTENNQEPYQIQYKALKRDQRCKTIDTQDFSSENHQKRVNSNLSKLQHIQQRLQNQRKKLNTAPDNFLKKQRMINIQIDPQNDIMMSIISQQDATKSRQRSHNSHNNQARSLQSPQYGKFYLLLILKIDQLNYIFQQLIIKYHILYREPIQIRKFKFEINQGLIQLII